MFIDSLQAVIGVSLVMAVGYFLGKSGLVDEKARDMLSRLIILVALPCTVVSGFQNEFSMDMLSELYIVFLLFSGGMLLCLLLGWLWAKIIRLPDGRMGQFSQCVAFSNGGFMGIPMVAAVFGPAGTPPMLMCYFAQVILFNTVGIALTQRDASVLSGKKQKRSPKDIAKSILTPPTIAVFLALALGLLGVSLPKFLMIAVDAIGGLTSPLALLFIGATVQGIGFQGMRPEKGVFAAVIGRLILAPALVFGVSWLLGVDSLNTQVITLGMCLSCAVQPITMSKLYGADTEYTAKATLYSIVGSIVTVPLIMAAVSMF